MLYQLWIAEGMVLSSDRSGEETMMEVAESYMKELVHKSMVQVKFEKKTYSLRIFKSCWLHDLMRDLCLYIAKEEEFFKVINLKIGNEFRHDLAFTRQVVVYTDVGEHRSLKDDPILINKATKQHLRSLLYFHGDASRDYRSDHVYLSWNVAHFRFLRVLTLEGTEFVGVNGCLFYANPGYALGNLVNLRYLSLNTSFVFFPAIQNLELLQTLKLKVGYDLARIAPWTSTNVLGKLRRLRHLYLPYKLSGALIDRKLRFDGLSKLETLENFNTEACEVKDLAKLTNLRELTASMLYSHEDVKEMMRYLQAIASSSGSSTSCLLIVYLEISYCDLKDDAHIWRQLLSSPNLRSLSLGGPLPELVLHNHIDHLSSSGITFLDFHLCSSGLEGDPMPVLEKLPILRKLKLTVDAFRGDKMVCSASGLLQLTHLEMFLLTTLREWSVEDGSIPNLSYLTIHGVHKLEELPEGLKFLKHLQRVHLQWMSDDFCDRLLVNGEQGPDFYKVAHLPSLIIN